MALSRNALIGTSPTVCTRGALPSSPASTADVLATAEDVFQKFPTDQEQSVRKAANLGQADQLCTFCWKGKHSTEACNHKKSGGKQLPKPEHLKTAKAQERAKRERERKDRASSGGAGEKPPCTWCQKPGHTEEEC